MFLYQVGENDHFKRRIYLHLVSGTDGITPQTAEAGNACQISINGKTPKATKNTLVAVDTTNQPGTYYVELDTSEIMTPGFISVRYKSANTAEFVDIGQIIAYDPYSKLYGEGGTPLTMAGGDISYSKVRTIVAEEIAKIPKAPECKETDLTPVSNALQSLFSEVRGIEIPEAKETDLKPVLTRIQAVETAINAIRMPETDLTPVLHELQQAREEVKPGVEATKAELEALFARVREFFTQDIESIKAEVSKLQQTLANAQVVVVSSKPQEPAEEKPIKFKPPKLI